MDQDAPSHNSFDAAPGYEAPPAPETAPAGVPATFASTPVDGWRDAETRDADTRDADTRDANTRETETRADKTAAAATPFVIEVQRVPERNPAYFSLIARVVVTRSLLTSGLLNRLPGQELRTLLFVLSLVSPDGRCEPTIQQLCGAMRISEVTARLRIAALLRFRWQGNPVLLERRRESGMHAFVPAPAIVTVAEAPAADGRTEAAAPRPSGTAPRISRREQVIAYSRARYGRLRSEVEAMIAEQNGWNRPNRLSGNTAGAGRNSGELRRRLENLGVSGNQADYLLSEYPIDRVGRQLEFLPHRKARNPAAFLVRAIERDYEPPRGQPVFEPAALPAPEPAVENDAPSSESTGGAGGDV